MRKDKPNLTFDELFEKVSTYVKDVKSKKLITFGNTESADVYGYNIRKEGMNTVFRDYNPQEHRVCREAPFHRMQHRLLLS